MDEQEKEFAIIPLEMTNDYADLYDRNHELIKSNVKVLKVFHRVHKYLKDFDIAEIFFTEEYNPELFYNDLSEESKKLYDFEKLTGVRGKIQYVYLDRLEFHEEPCPITGTKEELVNQYAATNEFEYVVNGLLSYVRFDTPYQYVGFWIEDTPFNKLPGDSKII